MHTYTLYKRSVWADIREWEMCLLSVQFHSMSSLSPQRVDTPNLSQQDTPNPSTCPGHPVTPQHGPEPSGNDGRRTGVAIKGRVQGHNNPLWRWSQPIIWAPPLPRSSPDHAPQAGIRTYSSLTHWTNSQPVWRVTIATSP